MISETCDPFEHALNEGTEPCTLSAIDGVLHVLHADRQPRHRSVSSAGRFSVH